MTGAQDFVGGSPTNNTHQVVKSPVPYLIGGIAAVMAVIALALLCSYQHQESNSRGNDINTSAAVECGEKNIEGCGEDTEEKVMVIMAGEERPTFIAKAAMRIAGEMEITV